MATEPSAPSEPSPSAAPSPASGSMNPPSPPNLRHPRDRRSRCLRVSPRSSRPYRPSPALHPTSSSFRRIRRRGVRVTGTARTRATAQRTVGRAATSSDRTAEGEEDDRTSTARRHTPEPTTLAERPGEGRTPGRGRSMRWLVSVSSSPQSLAPPAARGAALGRPPRAARRVGARNQKPSRFRAAPG